MPVGEVTNYLSQREADYLADLTTLCGLDSYSTDPDDVNQVVDWLAARLTQLGCAVERFGHDHAGDDLRAVRTGTGRGRLVLLGHSDTVYPRGTAAQRPVTSDGDTIRGPGTCDMKGGLLAGLYALAALDALDVRDYGEIVYLVVSDEEISDRHSIPLIHETCRGADAVLTLEAARANGDIVTARKGVVTVYATAHGHSAHAGVEPEKGRNAIIALLHQAAALDALNDPASGITVNVGVFDGGRLPNVVPDEATLQADVRAFTQAELDRLTTQIVQQFSESAVPGVTFSTRFSADSPPMPRTPAVARLEGMAQTIAGELGFALAGAATGGASDAAFAAAAGVPVLDGLGPVGGLDHCPDEYILRSSIVPRIALLTELMMTITRQSSN